LKINLNNRCNFRPGTLLPAILFLLTYVFSAHPLFAGEEATTTGTVVKEIADIKGPLGTGAQASVVAPDQKLPFEETASEDDSTNSPILAETNPQDSGSKSGEASTGDSSTATKPKKPHVLGKYGEWIDFVQSTLLGLDIWGSSATIPQGFLVPMFGYGSMWPYGKYDKNGKLVELLPILQAPDPFYHEGYFFKFDFNPRGSLQGYMIGLMYGITDRLQIGVNSMFAVLHIHMDPIFTPGTCERLGIATRDDFYKLIEELGRPAPKHGYDTKGADWGDTTVAVTYNYFRNQYFAGGFTGNLYLPTAKRANPNDAIIFGLGPELDVGNSAWGIGFVKMLDFRPPEPAKFISFSLGGEGAYYFQSERKSPKFNKPNQDAWDYLKAQGVDLDFFPNLSDLDSHYWYTAPPWVAASIGAGAGPISLTYRHGWGFEGNYESNSRGFKKIIKAIGLVGTGDDGKLIASATIPLTPIYIPGLIMLRYEYQTDGHNTLVFRDRFQAGIGFAVPINPPERYRMGGGK